MRLAQSKQNEKGSLSKAGYPCGSLTYAHIHSTSAPTKSADAFKGAINRQNKKVYSPKPIEKFYLPLETHLQKGQVSYIVPQTKGTKFKDSSLTFFELNEKEGVLYDLKRWFKAKENNCSTIAPNSAIANSESLDKQKKSNQPS